MAKEPLRVRVGDVASKDTELRRAGSGDIVASNDTDGRLLSGVFWSRDRGGEPTDMSAGCAAVVTASTAWGVTMGTRSAGLEMEPRRRGDLIIVPVRMYASSKSRRSRVSRGVLSRAGSVSGPAHQQSSHEGSLGHHFKTGRLALRDAGSSPEGKANFPAIPAPCVEVGACARFRSVSSAGGLVGGRGVSAARAVRARVAGAAKIG